MEGKPYSSDSTKKWGERISVDFGNFKATVADLPQSLPPFGSRRSDALCTVRMSPSGLITPEGNTPERFAIIPRTKKLAHRGNCALSGVQRIFLLSGLCVIARSDFPYFSPFCTAAAFSSLDRGASRKRSAFARLLPLDDREARLTAN